MFEDYLASQLGQETGATEIALRVRGRIRKRAKRRSAMVVVGTVLIVALAGLVLTVGFEIVRRAAPAFDIAEGLPALVWIPVAGSAALFGAVVFEILRALANASTGHSSGRGDNLT